MVVNLWLKNDLSQVLAVNFAKLFRTAMNGYCRGLFITVSIFIGCSKRKVIHVLKIAIEFYLAAIANSIL